jgi:hypothetical protein
MRKIVGLIALLLVLSIYGWAQGKSDWITGTWRGTGRQFNDGSTWSMSLVAGKKKYQIKYPSLKCIGEWRLIRLTSKSAKFRERIHYGVSKCEPRGTIIVKRLKGRRIEYNYFYSGSKRVGAYAILYRKRS